MTRLLFLCGSQRRESFNYRLLRHIGRCVQSRCEIDIVQPNQVKLPIFDEDLESDPDVIDQLISIHQRFKDCDGLVVASPEYNGQPSAYLKNLVDWISRLAHIDNSFENPFRDRPVLLCSASTGWSGGAVAIPHARALFGYVGCLVLGDTICIPYANNAWTEDGYRFDPFYESQIDEATTRIFQYAQLLGQTRQRVLEESVG